MVKSEKQVFLSAMADMSREIKDLKAEIIVSIDDTGLVKLQRFGFRDSDSLANCLGALNQGVRLDSMLRGLEKD